MEMETRDNEWTTAEFHLLDIKNGSESGIALQVSEKGDMKQRLKRECMKAIGTMLINL
jgi:hypothetical protein